MRLQILVRLKAGVLDVQGKAIEHGIATLGFNDISDVRVGKLIELDVKATSIDGAKEEVERICKEFLANPIIENYEIRMA